MGFNIPIAFINTYSALISMLSQQKDSRLSAYVRKEPLVGENYFFEQIGATKAVKKTERHMDTPLISTPHYRRVVSPTTYIHNEAIDGDDQYKLLTDPTSKYVQNAIAAFNREKDLEIIAASTGTSRTGKDGTTFVDLPAEQIIVHGNLGLNVAKLRAVRTLFRKSEVDKDMPLYMCVTSQQIDDLLAEDEVINSDFNTVKTLVDGDVETFMGFKFIHSEQLELTGDIRKCFAWAHDGIVLGISADVKVRIGERPDKSYMSQIFTEMTIGTTRMEEVKVVQVECDEVVA